ncbi:MAG: CRTAC1 family protein [Planctomycetota bacterium]
MTRPLPRAACAVLASSLLASSCGSDAPDSSRGPATAVVDEPGEPAGPPWFAEEARARGLEFVHASGADGRFLMPEIMTTAAALFDADGDGDLDAYLGQAGGVDAPRGERPGNGLFENVGDGRFEDRTAESGADDRGYAMGVTAGDYDGDGDVDLFVSNLERNALLRNDGGFLFTDVTEDAGLGGDDRWSASAAFLDADGDGDLDLFVTNYVEWSVDTEIVCRSPRNTRTYCSPKSYKAPARDQLFENDGDGTFTDVSSGAGLGAAYGNGLGVVCADFDLDGAPEIFVANDGTPNQLWDRDEDGRYADRSTGLGCAVDIQGRAKAGMGVAVADHDLDGDEDLLVVNLTGEDDSFYRNDGGSFVDRTPAVGLAVVSRKRTRFGVALEDLDLDGRVDLFHANGRVTEPGELMDGDPFAEENVVMRGLANGRFEEITPRGGVASPLVATSRAAAFGDVDGDGDLDVLVHNRDGAAHLLINVAPRGGAHVVLDVRDANGAPAIGAALTVQLSTGTLRREVRVANSYGAASSHLVHLGLPEGESIERVDVAWPGGATASLSDLAPGELRVVRP